MFLFGAPGGSVDPWGPGGLGLSCLDALYFRDDFNLLAYSQAQWSIAAPGTVSGGLAIVPDASSDASGTFTLTGLVTGTLDFAIQIEYNMLQDIGITVFSSGVTNDILGVSDVFETILRVQHTYGGNSGAANPNLLGLAYGADVGQVLEDVAITPGTPYTCTFLLQRINGTLTFHRDGVLKRTVAHAGSDTVNIVPDRSRCSGAGALLARSRFESFQFARC